MFKIQIATITETAITITETIAVAGEEITTTAETTITEITITEITITEIAITIRKKKINHGINSGTDPFNQSR